MGPFENDHTVILIKNRMKSLGVDMDRYIGLITNTWNRTPCGFGFTCKDKATYSALMNNLVVNRHFGSDSMLGSSQHLGASYREVNQFDSLHIVLSSRQNPGGSCSVHLDSVSPVVGRDDKTGHIIYDPGKVLQHLTTDLLHTPLIIVPGSEQGIVFGIRF